MDDDNPVRGRADRIPIRAVRRYCVAARVIWFGGFEIAIRRRSAAFLALALVGVVVTALASVGASAVLAADPPYTGFMVDSETGNPFGGGQLHDHFPSIPTATGTPADFTIAGNGWTFEFEELGGLKVGSYFDGITTFRLGRNGTFCSSSDWTFEVFEAPVSVDGVITVFAADFWRNRCGSAHGHAIYGSIRIGSTTPIEMLHVTSALDFPDTYVGEVAPDQVVQVLNAGDTTIEVDALALAGTNALDFPTTDSCGPVELDPGQECTITVRFEPSGTTDRAATVTLPSTAYGPSRQIDLAGYGLSTLLKTPSALIIDGQPGTFTNGDHWHDPVSMSATGDADDITVKALEWEAHLRTADGSPFAPGTYHDAELTAGNGHPGLRVTRGLRLCSEPYDGAFTVLEAPVIDSDGTILRFSADFEYTCPQLNGHTARGWIRFHSDLDRPVEEALGYSIEVDTGSAAQIGETITLTPSATGTDFLDAHRCQMVIESGDPSLDWVRMQVASDGCEPWTVTVPPSPLGSYRVYGSMRTAHGGTESTVLAPDGGITIGPGTPRTFTTNYPVQSWAASDLLSDPTPEFGSPVTIDPPAGLDACKLSMFGGFESAITYQDAGCSPWTLTLPVPTPDVVAPFFGDRADVRIVGWEGESDWSITNPDAWFVGARYGETYNAGIPRFAGDTGGSYASSLPAIFTDQARANVYYTDDDASHEFVPVVIGASSGSCTSDRQPLTRPVVGGSCGGFTVPPTTFTGNVDESFRLELRNADGDVIAEAATSIGFVDHLAPLVVDAPAQVRSDQSFPIEVDSATGAPATYEITVAPAGGLSAASVSDPVTYRGTLTPGLGSGGGGIAIDAAGLGSGTWDVTATFTDVLGGTSTGTDRISVSDVLDTTPPTATAPSHRLVNGSTISAGRTTLRLGWTGSDATSGVARYELAQSTDGGGWTTVSANLTSTSLDRALAHGHTYRFRVRAVDEAGNIGAWMSGPVFRLTHYGEASASVRYSGSWSASTSSVYWGGKARASSQAGAKATLTFTGRAVEVVSRKGPARGKAQIYVNGALKATVDLYAAAYQNQRVVWTGSWASSATRTVTVRVVGTSGRPRVDLDAFVVVS